MLRIGWIAALCWAGGACAQAIGNENLSLRLAAFAHWEATPATAMAGQILGPGERLRQLERYRAAKDAAGQTRILVAIGNDYASQGRYPQALAQYEQALALGRDAADLQAEAACLSNIGVVMAAQGRIGEAQAQMKLGLNRYIDAAAQPYVPPPAARAAESAAAASAANAAVNAGPAMLPKVLGRLGYPPELAAQMLGLAGPSPEQSRAFAEQIAQAQVQAQLGLARQAEAGVVSAGHERSLLNLASLAAHTGQPAQAVDYLQRALDRYPKAASPAGAKAVLETYALVYRRVGDDARAAAYARRASNAPAANNTFLSVDAGAIALTPGGAVPLAATPPPATPATPVATLGMPPKAELLERELEVQAEQQERAGNPAGAIGAFSRIALAAEANGNPERARSAHANLQRLHAAAGATELAVFHGKRAVNAAQRMRADLGPVEPQARQAFLADKRRSYAELARLLLQRDRLAEAETVLRLLKEDEGQQFQPLAAAPAARGQLPLSLAEAALAIESDALAAQVRTAEERRARLRLATPSRLLTDSRADLETLRRRSIPLHELTVGTYGRVLARFPEVIERRRVLLSRPAATLTSDEQGFLRQSDERGWAFLAGQVRTLEALLKALREDSADFLPGAWAAEDTAKLDAVQARLAELLDANAALLTKMAASAAAQPAALPPVTISSKMTPTETLPGEFAGMMLPGGIVTDMTPQNLWRVDRELERLDAERSRLDAKLASVLSQRPAVAFNAADAKLLDTGRKLVADLPRGTAALYYLPGDDALDILLVTAAGREARRQPIGRAELGQRIAALRRALQARGRDPSGPAHELYDTLIAPLADKLREAGIDTLMLALDGELRDLPFAALHDGRQWLIERYAVERYTTAAPTALTARPAPAWRAAAFGATAGGQGFDALPAVRSELEGIVRDPALGTRGVLPGVIRFDRAFTAEALQAALRERPNVVHIASHFAFQKGNADASFLLLGDGNRLSLAELKGPAYRLDKIDLVTLSACETALGGTDGFGQEVEGLGNLLQSQGAAAVLATLWRVDDAGTGVFMQTLYAARERRGLTRAQAVRAAQLALLGRTAAGDATTVDRGERVVVPEGRAPAAAAFPVDPARRYAHPYYWAPFVLMGNWL